MPDPIIPPTDNPTPPVDKTHSEKAFRQVSDDMHKYKDALKELTASMETMKAEATEAKRVVLEKNEQYKELYETELLRNDELQKKLEDRNTSFITAQKLTAVKEKLGQFKKPEYNKFIDTSRIIVDNDGNVDLSTVDNEVSRLKQEYPELIKVKASSKLPDEAPESGEKIIKPLEKMTPQVRSDMRRKLIEERTKQ